MRSFCEGIPELEAAIDLAAPTAEAVQRVMEEVFGLRVVPTSTNIEQGGLHRPIDIRCMCGFKSSGSAERFCRSHDELRNFRRPRTRHNQHAPAGRRRLLHFCRATTALAILDAA